MRELYYSVNYYDEWDREGESYMDSNHTGFSSAYSVQDTAMAKVHRGFNSTLQLTFRLLKIDETASTVSARAHAVSNRLSKLNWIMSLRTELRYLHSWWKGRKKNGEKPNEKRKEGCTKQRKMVDEEWMRGKENELHKEKKNEKTVKM
jgi:hypothetical protein